MKEVGVTKNQEANIFLVCNPGVNQSMEKLGSCFSSRTHTRTQMTL